MAYPSVNIAFSAKDDAGNSPSAGAPTAMSQDAQDRIKQLLAQYASGSVTITFP